MPTKPGYYWLQDARNQGISEWSVVMVCSLDGDPVDKWGVLHFDFSAGLAPWTSVSDYLPAQWGARLEPPTE